MPKEEKGYWFSTENGTHIHAEEGESKEQAMGKKFGNFKKNNSLNFPSPTKEEHQATLDKEIKNTFRNREEGLRYLENETKDWTDEEKESLRKRIDRVYPEDDLPMKVESRSTINEKQSNNPSKLADKIGKEENSMGKYKNMSLKEKWDAYEKIAYTGNSKDIDESNELIGLIESEMPFKNKEEHEKWLDMFSYNNGEPEFDDLTAKIIGRKEQPKEKNNSNVNEEDVEKNAQKIISSGEGFTYQMLDRLRSDMEYVLDQVIPMKKEHPEWFSNESTKIDMFHNLWYEKEPYNHIALMKKLHNSLKDKPEWLTMDKINEFEKRVNDYLKE